MFDLAGYSLLSWAFLLLFLAMPAVGVGFILLGVEWLYRASNEDGRPPRGQEYSKDNLWLSRHKVVLAVLAYAVVLSVFYWLYVSQVCGVNSTAEFCP